VNSHEHALGGLLTSVLLAGAFHSQFSPGGLAALVVYGVLLSVFIDLDHFLIVGVLDGELTTLRACLRDPVWAFTDQEAVFAEQSGLEVLRLLSHALIGGVLSVLFLVVSAPTLAVFTACVVAVHGVLDLLRDAGIA